MDDKIKDGQVVMWKCHCIYDRDDLQYADKDGYITGKVEAEPFKCTPGAALWYFVFEHKGQTIRWMLGDEQPSYGVLVSQKSN